MCQVGHDRKGRPLQLLIERYAPGTGTATAPHSHSGDEGGAVIQGQLEVTVGGRRGVPGPGRAVRARIACRTGCAMSAMARPWS
ncbi:MAG: cupin domain-containing protein [Pseudomonadota bacterium]|nr:cupin domain-containing protein [Rubrivivax sp.]MCA3260111.1 cupin domain-containing protein [Rubrivivax sp.]